MAKVGKVGQPGQFNINLKCVKTNLTNKKSLTRVGTQHEHDDNPRDLRGHYRQVENYHFKKTFDKNTGH